MSMAMTRAPISTASCVADRPTGPWPKLAKENIDPSGVLVLRHTPHERGLRKVLPWLAAEHPDIFNAYQSTQDVKVEAAMLKAKHVAFNDWHRFILH
jgi:hypothetical protein